MKRAYPESPLVGVGAVIFKGDEVLLVKRGKPPRAGDWSLPGGMQDLGERVAETAKREVLEETGITADIGGLCDTVDSIHFDEDGKVEYHYTIIDLWGTWTSGEPVAGDDVLDARFFAPGALKDLGLWSEAVRIIAKARGMKNDAKT